MEWKKRYAEKKVPAEQVLAAVKSGNRVVTGHAAGEPSYIMELLVANREAYEEVEIMHMLPLGNVPYVDPGMEKHFRHNSLFVGRGTREAVHMRRADYTPCYFYMIPELFQKHHKVDVAIIQVSAPDERGYCSFGTAVDYIKAAAESAEIVIAQVNRHMPYLFGNASIHVDEIDYIVEHDRELPEIPGGAISDAEWQIGQHCAGLIEDGDTLQLGIGSIPDAVLQSLGDKRDLGIHTEMFSDSIIDLFEKGIITNERKEIHTGKSVVSFVIGTRKLYQYIDRNPAIEGHPIEYVNHPLTICKHKNFVSINSCVEIDLFGQVVSETVAGMQISGVGGQVDFVRGTSLCENGRSIIALSSCTAGGASKIVSHIHPRSMVTTTRNDVDFVATEYGIRRLRGLSLRERAKALIEIAHPQYREELSWQWQKEAE